MPTGEALHECTSAFNKLGLPGFVSSIDVVHLRYDRCPYAQRPNYKGKEGYPTIAYQFHVGHNSEIFWLSPEGFPGARNDKTIVMYDDFLRKLTSDPLYCNYEYEIFISDGEKEVMRGLHSLCDGGYHKWLHTISAVRHAPDIETKAWSNLCESTRKDVECVFGILKKRFRVLATAFLDFEAMKIDNTIKACAILHNMLLKHSGLSNIGQAAQHWRNVDRQDARKFGLDKLKKANLIGSQGRPVDEPTMTENGYEEKRAKLIRHYSLALRAGEVFRRLTAADVLAQLELGEDDVGIEGIEGIEGDVAANH